MRQKDPKFKDPEFQELLLESKIPINLRHIVEVFWKLKSVTDMRIGLQDLAQFEHFYGIDFDTQEVEYILELDRTLIDIYKEKK